MAADPPTTKVLLPRDGHLASSLPPMIRDFDESGGRSWRGPESFKRPALKDMDLDVLCSNEGQASVMLQQVIDLLKAGKIAHGVRRAKALAVWLEGQPMVSYASNLSWLMWHLSTYAPAVVLRMARRAMPTLPAKGTYRCSAVMASTALIKAHRRRGSARDVRAWCEYMLKKWSDYDMYNLAYLPYFCLSELLSLEGKHAEALPLAEKSLAHIKSYGAVDYRLKYAAHLLHAELCEALGRLAEAHARYVAFLDNFGDHSYMPRALHERVWGGFNRTKPLVRLKF